MLPMGTHINVNLISEHFDSKITLNYAEDLGKQLENYFIIIIWSSWYKMSYSGKLMAVSYAQMRVFPIYFVMINTSNYTQKSDLRGKNYKISLKCKGIGAKWAPYNMFCHLR